MQRLGLTTLLSIALLACAPKGGEDDEVGDGDSTGDGDGDGDTTGDGDGDTTGDGDGDGDTTGDGDGDGDTTGDGDGDGDTTGDGDGDGDTTGDGDGDGDCSGAGVGVCESEPMSDAFEVDAMTITGDCLEIDVSYGGGCADHTYESCWDMSFAESDPVQAWLWIDHDAMNDPCDAIISDTWTIDLTAIKTAWQEAYQSQSGTIILHVAGDSINYDF